VAVLLDSDSLAAVLPCCLSPWGALSGRSEPAACCHLVVLGPRCVISCYAGWSERLARMALAASPREVGGPGAITPCLVIACLPLLPSWCLCCCVSWVFACCVLPLTAVSLAWPVGWRGFLLAWRSVWCAGARQRWGVSRAVLCCALVWRSLEAPLAGGLPQLPAAVGPPWRRVGGPDVLAR